MNYFVLIILTLIIGGFATFYVRRQLSKYSEVPASSGLTGREVAERMLAFHGVQGVRVQQGAQDQDHFDPRDNSISLSPDVYQGRSLTATATAAHEVGHAVQFAQGYSPMKIRSALVPVANFASNIWIFLFILGIMTSLTQFYTAAIVLYGAAVLFQLVTLPVEFNASSRALSYLQTSGMPQTEQGGAYSVLRACAFTYVTAALTSILQLLWLLGHRNN